MSIALASRWENLVVPPRTRVMTLDRCSGLLYWGDPAVVVAKKCAALILVAPLHVALITAKKGLYATFHWMEKAMEIIRSSNSPGERFRRLSVEVPKTLALDLWDVVKSPFYGIAMVFAALTAVHDPLQARVWVAKIEREWQGMDYTHDCHRGRGDKKGVVYWIKHPLRALEERTTFLAWCFQPRGTLHSGSSGSSMVASVRTSS